MPGRKQTTSLLPRGLPSLLPATSRLNAWLKLHNQALYCRRTPYPKTITSSRSTFRCPRGSLRPRRPRSPACPYHPVGPDGVALLAGVDHELPAIPDQIPGGDIVQTRAAPPCYDIAAGSAAYPGILSSCIYWNLGLSPCLQPRDGNMHTGRITTTSCCVAGSTAEAQIRMTTPMPQLTARHDD